MERKLIAAAVSSALAVPMAAQAVEFAVSGQVNRAVIVVDQDGHAKDGDLQHVDSNASQSRFRFTGSEELDSGLTAGVNMELGVLSTGTSSGTTTRHAAVYLDGAGGKLTLGHTSAAADGMAHADNAFNGGSWLGGVTNWCAFHGAPPAAAGPACLTNDGGRIDVLRYDTPSLGPVGIAASAGDDDYWDAKLSVAGAMGEAAYDFRLGYIAEYDASVAAVPGNTVGYTATEIQKKYKLAEGDSPFNATAAESFPEGGRVSSGSLNKAGETIWHVTTPGKDATTKASGDILTASGAVSFGQGTSVGAAWSKNEMPAEATKEHEYFYATVDHSYGDGSVGVYWKRGETSDSAAGKPDVEGTLWGIGMGHNIGGGATAYAGFRRIEEDDKEDINLYLAGLRVTFN